VALGILLLAPRARAAEPGSASEEEPHPFLEWGGCRSCHEQEPNGRPGGGGGGTRLKKLVPVCLSCHPGEKGLHPVGIAPDFDVSTDLLLEPDGSIGCITCHRAHGQRYDRHRWISTGPLERLLAGSGQRHKTYFLRRANPNGELCRACHFVVRGRP